MNLCEVPIIYDPVHWSINGTVPLRPSLCVTPKGPLPNEDYIHQRE